MQRSGLESGNRLLTILTLFLFLILHTSIEAGANEIEKLFSGHDNSSQRTIDHSLWDGLLKLYVDQGVDGLNRVNYRAFKKDGSEDLGKYLVSLQYTDVTKLNRNEQFAFWVNLYNAATVDIVLQHYPVASIRDIDISPGLFADGPWGKKFLKINGISLSLDDIEHRILRRLWKDPRVHYAVNCASVGCPNLAMSAYTSENLEEMLEAGARAYVNSSRGVNIINSAVVVSRIYSWFGSDFGSSEENILDHLKKYALPDLQRRLSRINSISGYAYDWSLNDVKN